jgi:hypothetical protein
MLFLEGILGLDRRLRIANHVKKTTDDMLDFCTVELPANPNNKTR